MAQSLAEKYRKHRQVMELARELGVTPREAEAVMQQRAARARWEETNRRLQARMQGRPAPRPIIPQSLLAEGEPLALWYNQGSMA